LPWFKNLAYTIKKHTPEILGGLMKKNKYTLWLYNIEYAYNTEEAIPEKVQQVTRKNINPYLIYNLWTAVVVCSA
jgi:hypothetical protein